MIAVITIVQLFAIKLIPQFIFSKFQSYGTYQNASATHSLKDIMKQPINVERAR